MLAHNAATPSKLHLSCWYAAYTYPRHERVVAEQLKKKGVEVFWPTYNVESRWKDRTVRLLSPLFPSYVFTRIRLAERVTVLSVPGVVRILSANGAPTPIPDDEIDAVRRCIVQGAKLEPHCFTENGIGVRVLSGPLAGLEGIAANHNKKCRVVLSVAAIQQAVSLELDYECLEPLFTA